MTALNSMPGPTVRLIIKDCFVRLAITTPHNPDLSPDDLEYIEDQLEVFGAALADKLHQVFQSSHRLVIDSNLQVLTESLDTPFIESNEELPSPPTIMDFTKSTKGSNILPYDSKILQFSAKEPRDPTTK